jgi:hypothetical protein
MKKNAWLLNKRLGFSDTEKFPHLFTVTEMSLCLKE